MYPVNNYLIIEEVREDVAPPNGTTAAVLYKPPTDSVVRKYRVVKSDDPDYQEDNIIAVQVGDVLEFFDGQFVVKPQNIIAEVRGE